MRVFFILVGFVLMGVAIFALPDGWDSLAATLGGTLIGSCGMSIILDRW